MRCPRLLAFPCLLVLIQSCASGAAVDRLPQQPTRADICALIREPQVYDGRMVRVDAHARPGAHYEILIYGTECPESVVVLSIPNHLEDKESVVRLREHVFAGFPAKQTRASAILVGRFIWYEDQVPARVLSLSNVESVTPEKGG